MHQKAFELLYRSFDQPLTVEEQHTLNAALAQSSGLQKEKQRLAELREMVEQTGSASFSPFFADNVMRTIRLLQDEDQKEYLFFEELFAAFRPIAITVTVLVIGLLSYNLTRSDDFSLSSAFGEPEITLEQVLEPSVTFYME